MLDSEWRVLFYRSAQGNFPVRDFLDNLEIDLRVHVVGRIKLLARMGVELRSPHAKHVEKEIWELRYGAVRIFYAAVSGRRLILLHAIMKKRNRIPRHDIVLAHKRLNDFRNRDTH